MINKLKYKFVCTITERNDDENFQPEGRLNIQKNCSHVPIPVQVQGLHIHGAVRECTLI